MFNTANNTPPAEIDRRIAALQETLRKTEIDGALILQPTDLFYFSGTIQQSHLYIPAEGRPLLMVRKSYERARAESPLEQLIHLTSPKKLPDLLQAHGLARPQRLGLEMDVLPANLYLMYDRIFRGAEIVDISPAVRTLRAVKSEYEVSIIEEAARRADQLFGQTAALLREGISEVALAGQIEAAARAMGHQGVVRMRLWGSELFYGHLMCGPAAAVPSYLASPTGGEAVSPAVAQGPGFNLIRAHEPILVDYVFVYKGCISDQTRIFSLGDLPDELLQAHEAMLAVQTAVKEAGRPEVKSGTLYDLAVEQATALGWEKYFMGAGPERIRFVGHGVGLELDEFPFLAQRQETLLEEGMVIALEPKVIIPGKGVVGIENTHVVTKDGFRQLNCFPEAIQRIDRA